MHHPVIPTILMGLAMKLGTFILNNNFGIFLYNFPQYVISSLIIAYLFKFLNRIKAPRFFVILTFLFFLLNPIWLSHSYSLAKDIYYYLFFILFFIQFIEFYRNKNNFVLLFISGLLVSLFRNNGIYIVLLSFVVLLFCKNTKKLKLFFMTFSLFLIYISISVITLMFGIPKGNIREALSIPIQTTGRYIIYGDLDLEEKIFYSSVIYGGFGPIKQHYDPDCADGIKWYFFLLPEQYKEYIKYWFLGLSKAPKIYLDAVLVNYYGYVYPYKEVYKDEITYFDVERNPISNHGNFDLYLNRKTEDFREKYVTFFKKTTKMPVVKYLYRPGVYTFVFLLAIGYALCKKQKEILVLSIPLWGVLLFCFLSPVNACLRYILPLLATLPVLWGYILRKDSD